jgi:hypothetical protein
VRLSDATVSIICNEFKNSFLETDHLWLFGSRADLSKRGGDIDLYIETELLAEKLRDAKNKFYIQLIKQLGDQKIDIVVNNDNDCGKLIYNIAKKEGVKLL